MIQGEFTAGSQTSEGMEINGLVPLSISGTWAATVALQQSLDRGANWRTVESFIANIEVNIRGAGGLFRLTTTAHTSGTVDYQLGR